MVTKTAALLACTALLAGCGYDLDSPKASAKADHGVEPNLVCNEQLTTAVTLTGDKFTPMPSDTLETPTALLLPAIDLTRTVDLTGSQAPASFSIADDPGQPEASKVHWISGQQMTFQVDPALALLPGLYDITVTNPDKKAEHAATFTGGLAVVPRPSLTAVAPDILCVADADQTLVLTGTDLLRVGSTMPVARVTAGAATIEVPVSELEGCQDIPGRAGEVARCTSATVVIPQGSLAPGAYEITLTNPEPASCVSTDPIGVVVVPPPEVLSVQPDLVCNAQDAQTLTVTGAGFLTIGARDPVVHIGDQTFAPDSVSGCEPVPPPVQGSFADGEIASCTTVTLTVPVDALQPGDHPVMVINPPPADCHSEEPVNLHVAPPPSIADISPLALCNAQSDRTLAITGSGFLVVGGEGPTVTLGGETFSASDVVADDCAAVTGTFAEGDVETCGSLVITIPQGTFTEGEYPVVVTNPAPAGCSSEETIALRVEDPPAVAEVSPGVVCSGGGRLVITGSGFNATPTVTLEAAGQPTITASSVGLDAAGTQVTAQIPGGATAGLTYDVVVQNPDGCMDTPPHQTVRVVPGPIAYFADPEIVYNGINTRVTIFATTLELPLPPNAVELRPAGAAEPVTVLASTPVPGKPNRVQIVVPVDQPSGSYDVTINDATGCPAILPNAVRVTDALSVSIDRIVPSFGDTTSDTAAQIFRDTTAPAPGDAPFVATPRAFLNPDGATPSDVAIPLASVALSDADKLSTVVPANSPAGLYDLVVVNPDGTVGLLEDAFRVQTDPPPVVETVTRSSIVSATGQMVLVAGHHFRDATVALSCVDPTGAPTAPPPAISAADACDAQQSCTKQVTIDGSALVEGSVCVLRLTNADGSFFDFSAIGVTNPSLNLPDPKAGTPLNVGRRALVAAAGNATPAARFVYAIGGDGGAAAADAPFDSVELAPVDLFGNMGAWQTARTTLRTPRSFAATATVGRYVYVMGGSDGSSAVASAERALILSPREVPELDVDDLVPAPEGLDPGYWFYRISAVSAADDPENPGGESLPSDEFIVKVPALPGARIQVVLTWTPPVDSLGEPIPNVASYRIYRTPTANGSSGGEVLLATVDGDARSFADDGAAAPGTDRPMPLGSLGRWAPLPAMGSARTGAAGAMAFDPADESRVYIYALFGLDEANEGVASYEYLPVTIAANGRQTAASAWITGTQTTSTPRWQHGAWVADRAVSTDIAAGDTYVFVGGGRLSGGALTGKVEAGKVAAGGDLGALSDTPKDVGASAAGYGVCAANDQLFLFGGGNGQPSSGAAAATLVSPPPSLATNSWNSEGLTMTQSRYLMGSAVQSAFIFLVAGQTAADAASTSTEFVVW
ncbi:kelch repeat-containing protein [Sorangium sp. So ce302]|uniref:Kelch repeat-containing protein n=1 Tax=Sorangium sp. So ce302 TaxID=3133297 RepID=UPI003F637458